MDKWNSYGHNRHADGFRYERECLQFLSELREVWDGRVMPSGQAMPLAQSQEEQQAIEGLVVRTYDYHRVGHDRRPMSFLPDGIIGKGAPGCELYWRIRTTEGNVVLEIYSESDLTCELRRNGDGAWTGRWLRFEQMPIELSPVPEAAS